jgi:hypothetical protein
MIISVPCFPVRRLAEKLLGMIIAPSRLPLWIELLTSETVGSVESFIIPVLLLIWSKTEMNVWLASVELWYPVSMLTTATGRLLAELPLVG